MVHCLFADWYRVTGESLGSRAVSQLRDCSDHNTCIVLLLHQPLHFNDHNIANIASYGTDSELESSQHCDYTI